MKTKTISTLTILDMLMALIPFSVLTPLATPASVTETAISNYAAPQAETASMSSTNTVVKLGGKITDGIA